MRKTTSRRTTNTATFCRRMRGLVQLRETFVEPPKRTLLLYILGNDRKTTQATRGKTGAGSLRLFPRESCASFLRASAISAFAHGKRTEQRPRRFLVRAGATARISRARLTRIRRETRVGCTARAGMERLLTCRQFTCRHGQFCSFGTVALVAVFRLIQKNIYVTRRATFREDILFQIYQTKNSSARITSVVLYYS